MMPNVDQVSAIMSVDELSAMMSGVELCGGELILLLKRADLRSHLDFIEILEAVPQVSLVWDDGRRTTFAPFETDRAWLCARRRYFRRPYDARHAIAKRRAVEDRRADHGVAGVSRRTPERSINPTSPVWPEP